MSQGNQTGNQRISRNGRDDDPTRARVEEDPPSEEGDSSRFGEAVKAADSLRATDSRTGQIARGGRFPQRVPGGRCRWNERELADGNEGNT